MKGETTIAVTGATGTVGGELVRLLSEAGSPVRALTRRPDAAEPVAGVEWVQADLADRSRVREVFDGVDRVFLLTGNTDEMVRLQKNAVRAAERAGVAHVVKLSALGGSMGSGFESFPS